MFAPVAGLAELLLTEWTRKRFLARVRPHVLGQVMSSGVLPLT